MRTAWRCAARRSGRSGSPTPIPSGSCRSAKRWAAASWAAVASNGSPSGTEATARLTPEPTSSSKRAHQSGATAPAKTSAEKKDEGGEAINLRRVARALLEAVGSQAVTFPTLARAWPIDLWPHRDPIAYLGKDGGGGVGSGPGITIGAALALKNSGRLTVGVLGDGDCLMSMSALWTAARYKIPVLFIVANNRSYYNDELHQEGVARHRGRSPANRHIGQAIEHPAPDIAKLAEAQGLLGIGPVQNATDLAAAMRRGVEHVRSGGPCLIDVHIDPGHGRHLRESMAERSLAKKT